MKVLFELIKGIFLFMTIAIGIFFMRGDMLFENNYYEVIKQFLVPGYLILCGLMIGYLITFMYTNNDNDPENKKNHFHKIYARYFMLGLIIGVLLAIAYIVL